MKLSELIPDDNNANRGTERGSQMIENSLRNYGAGRSILIDKHGRIIGGNKTAEHAMSIGLEDVIVVKTDGKQLVAVQRTDLDLKTDKAAKELAIADNRSSQVSLDWDVDALRSLDVDLGQFWTKDEMDRLFGAPEPQPGAEQEPQAQQMRETYSILIEGLTEQKQADLLGRLNEEGVQCRALIS